ncbi:hypothetical protein [Rhodococcoides fascians]|uniref:hypothetical protein n=1 Tax=Rhodococcoides fascians TaxID=1828 RepID=UPI0037A855EB
MSRVNPHDGYRERREAERRAAEELFWRETGADYAALQATPDSNGPNAIPVPPITFSDDELKDF